MSNLTAISDTTFENEVIGSPIPVLVDFWAPWCGPCKTIAPILDEMAQKYVGKVKIVKMDVDENPGVPPKFNVRSIPTLILFKDGEVKANHIGMLSKSELASFLDANI